MCFLSATIDLPNSYSKKLFLPLCVIFFRWLICVHFCAKSLFAICIRLSKIDPVFLRRITTAIKSTVNTNTHRRNGSKPSRMPHCDPTQQKTRCQKDLNGRKKKRNGIPKLPTSEVFHWGYVGSSAYFPTIREGGKNKKKYALRAFSSPSHNLFISPHLPVFVLCIC